MCQISRKKEMEKKLDGQTNGSYNEAGQSLKALSLHLVSLIICMYAYAKHQTF